MTLEELNQVQGRAWEDVDVSSIRAVQPPTMQVADRSAALINAHLEAVSKKNHMLVTKYRSSAEFSS